MNCKFESELYEALVIYNRRLVSTLPEISKSATTQYSPRHERRMQKLFNRCERFYYPAIRTKTRRALTLAATLLLLVAATISVSAVGERFVQFVTEIYDVCTDLFFPSSDTTIPFVHIEPSYIPEGFVEFSRETDTLSNIIKYQKSPNETFIFYQFDDESLMATVDTENAVVEKIILKNNIEGMYVAKFGETQLFFVYNDSVFNISSQLPREEILKISESIIK